MTFPAYCQAAVTSDDHHAWCRILGRALGTSWNEVAQVESAVDMCGTVYMRLTSVTCRRQYTHRDPDNQL